MTGDVVYLVFLLALVSLVARESWLDRTPRKPFDWRRPELEWWAHKPSTRERKRSTTRFRQVGRRPARRNAQ